MDWSESLQICVFKMQKLLGDGIQQVINNCEFMNSLFSCTEKIDNLLGKSCVKWKPCTYNQFSFHTILKDTYYLQFVGGQSFSSHG